MKKIIILGIILLILAVVFIIYGVKSVTATPDIGDPEVILEIDEGGVEVWPAGEETWERAKDGQTLGVGDRVRTLEKSSASIIFYDTSVMRLDESTEITISELALNSENYLEQNIGVELMAGRAWSRILNLLDLDSTYEVKTSSVVATVRGTAFTLGVDDRGETELDVTENQVDLTMYGVASATGEIIKDKPRRIKLEAGRFVKLGAFKKLKQGESVPDIFAIEPQAITQEKLKTDWYLKNMSRDDDFAERVWGLRRDRLRKYIKLLPDSPFFGLQRISEKLGLAITGDPEKKEAFLKILVARRLAEVAELAHQDKVGLASQELIQFENSLKADGAENFARFAAVLPNLLYYQQGFWADVLPTERAYRLKQKMEELGMERNISAEQIMYWKLITIEGRLNEAQRLVQFNESEIVANVLEVARMGLENLQTEASSLPDSPKKEILLDRIEYDLKKFGLIQEEIKLLEYQSPELLQPEELELTEEGMATEEEVVAEPEESEPPVEEEPSEEEPVQEPTQERVLSSLSVSGFPNPVFTGASSDLAAQAYYVDGSNEDVTLKADWTMYGAIGTISNGIFYAGGSAGSARIEASYTSGGATKTASFNMTVKEESAPVTLDFIRLTSSKLVLGGYESCNLYVEAVYSDGSSRDVTGISSLTNANPDVGNLSGNTFSAYPVSATATITATYNEGGVTKTDGVLLTVTYP